MPSELTRLSSTQIQALSKQKTVFFFAVGPLEDHGSHLPIGLDLLEASECCQLAAIHLEETLPGWDGILMPPVPLGIDSNTTQLAITVRPHVLRDWLVDACHGLIRMGFFHFVCFSGHRGPKQLTAIEEAGKLLRRQLFWKRPIYFFKGEKSFPTLISANSAQVNFKDVLASPFWPDPFEHGGKQDTSLALALLPVGESVRDYQALPEKIREPIRFKRNWLRRAHLLSGYWGKPSEAQAEFGQKNLKEQIEDLFPKMRAVWEGAHPDKLFRSWYSIFPLNKSFFKAWLLVFWICILIMGWAFLRGSMLSI